MYYFYLFPESSTVSVSCTDPDAENDYNDAAHAVGLAIGVGVLVAILLGCLCCVGAIIGVIVIVVKGSGNRGRVIEPHNATMHMTTMHVPQASTTVTRQPQAAVATVAAAGYYGGQQGQHVQGHRQGQQLPPQGYTNPSYAQPAPLQPQMPYPPATYNPINVSPAPHAPPFVAPPAAPIPTAPPPSYSSMGEQPTSFCPPPPALYEPPRY